MQLFLVRHGQTEANLNRNIGVWGHNNPLTDEGSKQIIHAGEILQRATRRPALIIASPLLRTRQTASILADQLGLRVVIDARLQEASVGDWAVRPVANINNELRHMSVKDRPSFRPPKGETWLETGARVAELIAEQSDEVILVSHDAPIRFGVGTLLKLDPAEWSNNRFPTGSVSLLTQDGDGNWRADFLGKV